MYRNTVRAYSFDSSDSIVPLSGKVAPINRLYIPQTNGEISESIMQNWTRQAEECYEINAECSRCSLNGGNYSFICQMPKIVKSLLKAYGPPQKSRDEN